MDFPKFGLSLTLLYTIRPPTYHLALLRVSRRDVDALKTKRVTAQVVTRGRRLTAPQLQGRAQGAVCFNNHNQIHNFLPSKQRIHYDTHAMAFGTSTEAAEAAEAHQELLDQLDIHAIPKPFRNPNWKPNQRRNKNIKTILTDAIRKEASLQPTNENSGAATPNPDDSSISTDGESTPAISTPGTTLQAPNLAQASRNLSKLVLERNMRSNGFSNAPHATYTNIESAPSLAHSRRYCDITGLSAPYTDPKTRLRYHDKEVFGVIRSMGQGVAEQYLEARGAHTVLK